LLALNKGANFFRHKKKLQKLLKFFKKKLQKLQKLLTKIKAADENKAAKQQENCPLAALMMNIKLQNMSKLYQKSVIFEQHW